METMTLQQVIDMVTYEASIDGQVATTGRHSVANLVNQFNREWSSLRALVSANGMTQFLEQATGTVPTAATNEEYSILAWPAAASEIHGVDVKGITTVEGWYDLDPIQWASRRNIKLDQDQIGWWSVKKLPKENGASTPTDGEIAVFPGNLAGNLYEIHYLPHWVPISSSNLTFLIVGYPDWFQWLINTMVMTITKRDNNKKDTFAASKLMKDEAEARIRGAAKRVQRTGRFTPRRRDGMDL